MQLNFYYLIEFCLFESQAKDTPKIVAKNVLQTFILLNVYSNMIFLFTYPWTFFPSESYTGSLFIEFK